MFCGIILWICCGYGVLFECCLVEVMCMYVVIFVVFDGDDFGYSWDDFGCGCRDYNFLYC